MSNSNDRILELEAKLKEAEARNSELSKASNGKLTLKVSAKGAVSVYGMGRWPVTLYRSQMERFLDAAPQIKAFIAANSGALTTKPGAETAPPTE